MIKKDSKVPIALGVTVVIMVVVVGTFMFFAGVNYGHNHAAESVATEKEPFLSGSLRVDLERQVQDPQRFTQIAWRLQGVKINLGDMGRSDLVANCWIPSNSILMIKQLSTIDKVTLVLVTQKEVAQGDYQPTPTVCQRDHEFVESFDGVLALMHGDWYDAEQTISRYENLFGPLVAESRQSQ